MKLAGKWETVWENYVYQPLSNAIIRLNWENQKFLTVFSFFGDQQHSPD